MDTHVAAREDADRPGAVTGAVKREHLVVRVTGVPPVRVHEVALPLLVQERWLGAVLRPSGVDVGDGRARVGEHHGIPGSFELAEVRTEVPRETVTDRLVVAVILRNGLAVGSDGQAVGTVRSRIVKEERLCQIGLDEQDIAFVDAKLSGHLRVRLVPRARVGFRPDPEPLRAAVKSEGRPPGAGNRSTQRLQVGPAYRTQGRRGAQFPGLLT